MLAAVTALAALGAAGAALAGAAGLRVNFSGSLPRGLYRLERGAPAPRAFDLVLVCPPPAAAALARRRRYLGAGPCPAGSRPLGKLVLAGPGDLVELSAAGVAVAGASRVAPASRPLAADAAGRPLAHASYGRRRLGRGELWAYAPHPRSFDSRYFGPVAAAGLRGRLTPLWVTRSSPADRTLLELAARRRLPP